MQIAGAAYMVFIFGRSHALMNQEEHKKRKEECNKHKHGFPKVFELFVSFELFVFLPFVSWCA